MFTCSNQVRGSYSAIGITFPRASCAAAWLTLAAFLMAPIAANAQSAADRFPDRLITLVVGFGAGGATDVTARLLAEHMFRDMGAKTIVENKPGAAGRLAAENIAKQPADGYSLLVAGNAVVSVAKAIYPNLRYDPIRDFVPISIIADIPSCILVVQAEHPAKTFDELVKWTKANPDKSNYPTPGPSYTIPTEQLKLSAGISAQAISYRSGSEAITSVLNGSSAFILADPASALPMIEGGKLRALAVSGSARMEVLKDIPTLNEVGHKITMNLWVGLLAPAGTPKPIVEKLQREVQRVVNLPQVASRLRTMGLTPGGITSAAYRKLIADEVVDYGNTVRAAGLKFEE